MIFSYVKYFLDRIHELVRVGVIPFVVFDGGPLPMKDGTESDRHRRRTMMLTKGKEFYAAGNKKKAHECFTQCTDVTPHMALQVIRQLRLLKIKYVVAPYEADAQLAYLEKTGAVDGIITEDSDLLVFGCRHVLYKLDRKGNAIEIDSNKLGACEGLKMSGWSLKEFRHMCILSGCDYLANIPNMGLKKAHKLLRQRKTVENVVVAARLHHKMEVPTDYLKRFRQADFTFQHQRVFCTKSRKLVTLSPLDEQALPDDERDIFLNVIGPMLDDEVAVGIATGEIDPITKTRVANFACENIDPLPSTHALARSLGIELSNSSKATISQPEKPKEDGVRHALKQLAHEGANALSIATKRIFTSSTHSRSTASANNNPKPTLSLNKKPMDPKQPSIMKFLMLKPKGQSNASNVEKRAREPTGLTPDKSKKTAPSVGMSKHFSSYFKRTTTSVTMNGHSSVSTSLSLIESVETQRIETSKKVDIKTEFIDLTNDDVDDENVVLSQSSTIQNASHQSLLSSGSIKPKRRPGLGKPTQPLSSQPKLQLDKFRFISTSTSSCQSTSSSQL